jgi:hypothetical protein
MKKFNISLAEVIAIVAICIILYMLFSGYRGQDLVIFGGGSTQYVPVFFGGRRGRCKGPGPCPPKPPKKGPKLPAGMLVPPPPKIPKIPIKIPKIPIKIPLPPKP